MKSSGGAASEAAVCFSVPRGSLYSVLGGHFFPSLTLCTTFLLCVMPAVLLLSAVMGFVLMKAADCRDVMVNIMQGGMCQCRISFLRSISEQEMFGFFANECSKTWMGVNNTPDRRR